jgi:hypothetical protein
MGNPRFPHKCDIERVDGSSQLGDTESTFIYSGSCRKELNTWNDSHYQNAANTAQWILSLPVEVMVNFGDVVTVDDGISPIKGTVSDWQTTNITHQNSDGTFTKDADGKVTSLDGTTTKGMHIYVSVTKN